jgi:lipid A ethanolaminephosphotransferase
MIDSNPAHQTVRWTEWLCARRPQWTQEQLVAAVALYCVIAGNASWWRTVASDRDLASPSNWLFIGAVGIALAALHFVLLALPATRWTVRAWLSVLVVTTASASHLMGNYSVLIDASMLRNVLHTDTREASELVNLSLLLHVLLWSALPLAVIWWVRLTSRSWARAAMVRAASLLGALAIAAVALLPIARDFMSMMRNHHELRYLITPGNLLVGLVNVGTADARTARKTREAVGIDAIRVAAAGSRPRVFVLVIGETARAANFQLDGYGRATNPQLSALDIVNFGNVTACGTSTEVSLPCMFSPWGRRAYDEGRIRGAEGLLHVAKRAGYDVLWIDNQSGCKGVCEGGSIRQHRVQPADLAEDCTEDGCHDMALVTQLAKALDEARGDTVVVLHMLGNHGPAYFKRYPPEFRRFTPDCRSEELRHCSREEIVNAFDNVILYTDHVLASAIRLLDASSGKLDTALLYVSDHGESLGESGLYLHGLPYAIAPQTQTRVPMIYWQSAAFARLTGVDAHCLRAQAAMHRSHDNLFHSVLGLLDVETSIREPTLDLFSNCRTAGAVPRTLTAGPDLRQ